MAQRQGGSRLCLFMSRILCLRRHLSKATAVVLCEQGIDSLVGAIFVPMCSCSSAKVMRALASRAAQSMAWKAMRIVKDPEQSRLDCLLPSLLVIS